MQTKEKKTRENKTEKLRKNSIELLAPAGSFPSLIAAVNAGADAVYFGLKEFSMRATAKNFTIRDLEEIERICKPRGVKRYLTLNTIIYPEELSKIENIIKKIKGKIDAIICWDPAIIQLCKKYKIEFHISTQASIANPESAKFYKKLGAQRVVLARELNLEQVKKISKIIDIEVFGHGAMCVSVSGRCYTSQFLFGKSANRGECLQPCRRTYYVKDEDGNELKLENNMVMSPKDLCTLPFIEKIKKAGIRALKIEGRNREPEYVSTTTRVYKKALDKKLSKQEIEESLKELEKVYNKGFSSGFFLGTPTNDDFSKSEHSSASQRKEFIGKINKYLTEKQVAIINISSGKLAVGDELYVLGNKTGFLKHNIERIEIHHKPVSQASKGDEIGIKIPGVRKNDKIYLVVKK
ncbi:U32 family peptidase [Candidatus Pacearchaeota archaeon]|nr:U32 family peptidase [Candidatus Pacearchaeota archaeon]